MELKNKRIFISGGAGVIGSALVEKLLKYGAEIMVGDLKPRPKRWPANIRYRQGDLNYVTSRELLDFNPEVFFHLAATFERSVETYDFWDENYQHNLRLSNHLMSCLKDSKELKRVVFASSYLIYNPDQYYFDKPAEKAHRLEETDPICPRNLCGTAKLMHEMELKFLQHFNNYTTISARIFRVYGKNSRDVISRWIRSLLKGETLTVYKQEGLFDYIYADEVAEGLVRLGESDAVGIVNLGNDNARRVSEVLTVLKKYFPEMKCTYGDMDIPYEASQANMDYFKKVTGWKPGKQLEDAIPEMIAFEKKVGFDDSGNQADFNILVSSVSAKVPLVNSLRKASKKLGNKGKIIGGDVNSECMAKHFTDEFWQMPRLTELKTSDLIDYCKKNNVKAIIPTRDGELTFFATSKNELSASGIHVMISDIEVVEACLDKLKFYEKVNALGFPAIKTTEKIETLDGDKFVVKERYGAGSRNMGLKLSREEALNHAKKLSDPIFQPFVEGSEVSVDIYTDFKGRVKGAVVRSRDMVVDGESQITTVENNERLEKLSCEFAEQLGLKGHAVLQVLVDVNGGFHIIECNSRFGGASSLSLEYGLDSFYWFLLETNSADMSGYSFLKSEKLLRQIRYKADIIV